MFVLYKCSPTTLFVVSFSSYLPKFRRACAKRRSSPPSQLRHSGRLHEPDCFWPSMPLTTLRNPERESGSKARGRTNGRGRRVVPSRAKRPTKTRTPSVAPTVTATTTVTTSEKVVSERRQPSLARMPSASQSKTSAALKDATKPGTRPVFQLHSACVSIPHPAKRATHGEDACFQTPTSIGVFDGVGSWSRRRVNAGNYARRLANLVTAYLSRHRSATPQRALADAVSRNVLPGSCTATIASVYGKDKSYFLQGVNLGDAQLVIIRNNNVVFQTVSQQHGFNVPFQVSFAKRNDLFAAQLFEIKLRPNDTIVLATDGLWDNVFMPDVISAVSTTLFEKPLYASSQRLNSRPHPARNSASRMSKQDDDQSTVLGSSKHLFLHPAPKRKLQVAAESLAYMACTNAHQRSLMSPFAHKARRFGRRFSGGKLDDITIVVAQPVISYEHITTFAELSCSKTR